MGLNIPYPWHGADGHPIGWLPREDAPFGLIMIEGWVEARIEDIQEEQEDSRHSQDGGEHYASSL